MRLAGSFRAAALLLIAAAVGGGCKESVTDIGTLQADPGRYEGEMVRIAGTVTTAVGILEFGAYQVDDGTGVIIVVSKQGAPREGAKVGVEGRFRSVYTIGPLTGAALEERDRYEP